MGFIVNDPKAVEYLIGFFSKYNVSHERQDNVFTFTHEVTFQAAYQLALQQTEHVSLLT